MKQINTQEEAIQYLENNYKNYSSGRYIFEIIDSYAKDGVTLIHKILIKKTMDTRDNKIVGKYTFKEFLDFLIAELNDSKLQYQDEIDGRNKLFIKRINSWRELPERKW